MNQQTEAAKSEESALGDRLIESLTASVREVMPWFHRVMPEAYFRENDIQTRMEHLTALLASQSNETPLSLTLYNARGSTWTYLGEEDRPGLLVDLLKKLPTDRPLRSAQVYSALDGSLVVDVFHFSKADYFDPSNSAHTARRDQLLSKVDGAESTREGIKNLLQHATVDYLNTISSSRLLTHWTLYQQVYGSDDVMVDDTPVEAGLRRLTIAAGNVDSRLLFERIAAYLGALNMDIRQAVLDQMHGPDADTVTFFTFDVRPESASKTDNSAHLIRDLRQIKWIDKRALNLFITGTISTLAQSELLLALCDLTHQRLSRINPFTYARNRILTETLKHPRLIDRLTTLFMARFAIDTPMAEETFIDTLHSLSTAIQTEEMSEDIQRILMTHLDAVGSTVRSNVGMMSRYSLAIRLDPAFMSRDSADGAETTPFGIYFVHGRGFNGFHVRFRDIARGGVRVVITNNDEHHTIESNRHYDEVFGLASAQQLKNKDIPEGGSKAVILLEPEALVARSVKAFGDGMMDLLLPDSPALNPAIDRLSHKELLFFGPDENMTDDLIVWLVERARKRGYPMADTFMSSKPETGINHKEYGVTSEGVNVFLEMALLEVGINPRQQRFTLKITGGPDGDVAGNEIRILHREYGENAVIIGIADGTGSAEDPDGLDHTELLRLVDESRGIADFNPAALGPDGQVNGLESDASIALRNTLHNRLIADAFVPCGGRPSTIHADNWHHFLTDDKSASAKVIVEGANLFITEQARQRLSIETSVLIVKDSSANKAGVICSSYEITAAMLLDQKRFIEIKEPFVAEVLDRLRHLARRESELLFREYRRRPSSLLPALSVHISEVINKTAGVIESVLSSLKEDALLRNLVKEHLPSTLYAEIGDHGLDKMPAAYMRWIIASNLATRIIYHEGLTFLQDLDGSDLADLAINYLRQEQRVSKLITALQQGTPVDQNEVIALLQRGGVRSSLELGMS
ncbi:MAG: NAD-glutamate dehydrogenase [Magnetococcales bacterium]|nr:NAD-glutamate dehydrogenase [Magnetococcales bacterium]